MKQKKTQPKALPLGWIVTGVLGVLLVVSLILLLAQCGKKETPAAPGQQVRNGRAVIETYALPYTLTSEEGITLVSDGAALSGDMKLKSLSLESGAAEDLIPGTMVYEVARSDRFTFENEDGAAVSYAVSTDSYYGSVSGEGIRKTVIGTDGLEVQGTDLYASLILDISIGKCRNLYLDCSAPQAVTVRAEGQQIIVEGLQGTYAAALSNQDLQKSEDWSGTADGTLTLDLSGIEEDSLSCADSSGSRNVELIWLIDAAG